MIHSFEWLDISLSLGFGTATRLLRLVKAVADVVEGMMDQVNTKMYHYRAQKNSFDEAVVPTFVETRSSPHVRRTLSWYHIQTSISSSSLSSSSTLTRQL